MPGTSSGVGKCVFSLLSRLYIDPTFSLLEGKIEDNYSKRTTYMCTRPTAWPQRTQDQHNYISIHRNTHTRRFNMKLQKQGSINVHQDRLIQQTTTCPNVKQCNSSFIQKHCTEHVHKVPSWASEGWGYIVNGPFKLSPHDRAPITMENRIF